MRWELLDLPGLLSPCSCWVQCSACCDRDLCNRQKFAKRVVCCVKIDAFHPRVWRLLCLKVQPLSEPPSVPHPRQAALQHDWFKLHLGWEADKPRLLQTVLPNLVTAWAGAAAGAPQVFSEIQLQSRKRTKLCSSQALC